MTDTSRYLFEEVIRDSCLNKSTVIKADTKDELTRKIKEQRSKWDQQIKRQRESERIDRLKKEAEELTCKAKTEIASYETLLISALKVKNKVDWNHFYDKTRYKEFIYIKKFPTYEEIAEGIGIPQPDWLLEFLSDSRKRSRIEKETQAKATLKERIEAVNKQEEIARNHYETEKRKFELRQLHHNNKVIPLKAILNLENQRQFKNT